MEEFIKAAARPALSVMFGIALVVGVLKGIAFPEWFLGLSIPAILWWFGERTLTHAKERNSASIDKLAEKVAEAIIKRGQ